MSALNATLSHSATTLALANAWTYVACPPRVGKWGTGLGLIETHYDQVRAYGTEGK